MQTQTILLSVNCLQSTLQLFSGMPRKVTWFYVITSVCFVAYVTLRTKIRIVFCVNTPLLEFLHFSDENVEMKSDLEEEAEESDRNEEESDQEATNTDQEEMEADQEESSDENEEGKRDEEEIFGSASDLSEEESE